MKIQVEVEVPDDGDCPRCEYSRELPSANPNVVLPMDNLWVCDAFQTLCDGRIPHKECLAARVAAKDEEAAFK